MSRTIMLIPTDFNVGMNSIILGLINLMKKKEINYNAIIPINQFEISKNRKNLHDIEYFDNSVFINYEMTISKAQYLLENNEKDILIKNIISFYFKNLKNSDISLIKGLSFNNKYKFINDLNYEIARQLDAEIIFLISYKNNKVNTSIEKIINLNTLSFNKISKKNIFGVILNKVSIKKYQKINKTKKENELRIIGCIPFNKDLIFFRTIDIFNYINAKIINQGEIYNRKIKSIIFCHKNLINELDSFNDHALLVIAIERIDLIISSIYLSEINNIKIGGILLVGQYDNINYKIFKIFQNINNLKLPIFQTDSFQKINTLNIKKLNLLISINDIKKIKIVKEYISKYIFSFFIEKILNNKKKQNSLTPYIFLHKLTEMAKKNKKSIILPEGNNTRIIKAAFICSKNNIAKCILLGKEEKIYHYMKSQGWKLNSNIDIIDPDKIRKKYINRLVELRKHKGMTKIKAAKYLQNNVVLSTMILESNKVDGLVCGVEYSTADTIRPALQLIKKSSHCSLISSIFFMLFSDRVLLYADCAINPNPNAKELAEIAIQSAESAERFGFLPKVAMISYSTGNSSKGKDVEKIHEATKIAKLMNPSLIIEGPLQYDAAVIPSVAKVKLPTSVIAGNANVIIFPDLNTGNTTYKAVQRSSSNIIAIGPILQGISKPINDLSRGALMNDIIYTIALTSVQDLQKNSF